jgi:hypothetical protein
MQTRKLTSESEEVPHRRGKKKEIGQHFWYKGYFYNTCIFIGWRILTGRPDWSHKNYDCGTELLIWQVQCHGLLLSVRSDFKNECAERA